MGWERDLSIVQQDDRALELRTEASYSYIYTVMAVNNRAGRWGARSPARTAILQFQIFQSLLFLCPHEGTSPRGPEGYGRGVAGI